MYSLDYDSLLVSIGYRGKQLGHVASSGGHVEAREMSYANATLQLDGVEILTDVILLLEDLAKGAVVFDTMSEISGRLVLHLFDLPLEVCANKNSMHTASLVGGNCLVLVRWNWGGNCLVLVRWNAT